MSLDHSIVDVLLLRDHQTRVVVIGAALLGMTGGVVGVFTLLRKRALLADALAHATLPGVAGAFLLASWLGFSGKNLPVLLAGASFSAVLAACAVTLFRRHTRLKEDAVLGAVLSVSFGIGIVLLSIVQQVPTGGSAGLEGFIFGKTASMTVDDVKLIAGCAAIALGTVAALFKELRLLCFDADFASGAGFSTKLLDLVLMGLVILVSVVGLQAVGLVMVISVLIIPAVSARLCTHRLSKMIVLAGGLGGLSGWLGATASGLSANLPSGATIVLASAGLFFFCLLFGPASGMLPRLGRARANLRDVSGEKKGRFCWIGIAMSWISLDTAILLVGVLASAASALPGCFLVLRRMSLMGDAISHAILPGLVVAFLISTSRAGWPMFLGALVVGVMTAFGTETLRRLGKIEESASMGIVFTTLFAVGVVLVSVLARQVDLDPNCVLNGNLESIATVPADLLGAGFWSEPSKLRDTLFSLAGVLILNVLVVVVCFKELRITSFDPQLATSLGINATLMHYLLMSLTALTTVAAFEAVGAILVVAMLIVPAACAHLLCDRLGRMIWIAVGVAIFGAIAGQLLATKLPEALGLPSVSVSGMVATTLGVLLTATAIFSPSHGVLSRAIHRAKLAREMLREDILLSLSRFDESEPGRPIDLGRVRAFIDTGEKRLDVAVGELARAGFIELNAAGPKLTEPGRREALRLLRTHRLWESYLSDVASLAVDHVHGPAHRLEHLKLPTERVASEVGARAIDPQSKPIPPADPQ